MTRTHNFQHFGKKVSIFDIVIRFTHLGHPYLIMTTLHRLMLDRYDPTPPPENRAGGSYTNSTETNFDTNMVIILAALLCALICALGLNTIVRCALRCFSRRFAFETAEEAAVRLASKGLKKSALRKIPVAVYGAQGIRILATECPICLGEFLDGEKVRVLPKCNHGYHVRCIDTWLASHSSCPTCRQSLLEQPSGKPGSGNGCAGTRGPVSGGQSLGEVAVAV